MSGERDTYHHGDLRGALIAAAHAAVEAQGIDALSLRRIAKAVGVDPSASYRHFRSKDELAQAVAAEGYGELTLAMERALDAAPADDATERFLATGRAYVHFALAKPNLFRAMFAIAGQDGVRITPAGPVRRDAYEILSACLDDLERETPFAPAKRATAEALTWSMIHGLANLLIDGHLGAAALDADALSRASGLAVLNGLRV